MAAHYVIVLDISGSMSNRDCEGQDGSVQERIQAAAWRKRLLYVPSNSVSVSGVAVVVGGGGGGGHRKRSTVKFVDICRDM